MYTKGCCVTCSKSYHWLVNKGRRKLCRASMAGLMTMRENREMNREQKAPLGRWIVRAWSWGLANWHKGDPGRIWQIIPHGFWQESGLNSLEGLHLSSSSGSKASYTYKCYVSFFFFLETEWTWNLYYFPLQQMDLDIRTWIPAPSPWWQSSILSNSFHFTTS